MTSIYVKEKAAQGTPTATYGQIWVENTVPASFHIEDDAGALAEVNVGTLIATTLTGTLSTAAQTNITSVGALNGGSITSGFGSIDNGSSTITTTGALSCGTFTSTGIDDNATGERLQIADTRIDVGTTGAGYQLRYVADDYSLGLFGGSGANCAQIYLYGGTTAAIAGDIQIRGGGANQLYYDDSASSWDFQANAIYTTGNAYLDGNNYFSNNGLTTQNTFYLSATSTVEPIISFDSNDFIRYNRTTNILQFVVGGDAILQLLAGLIEVRTNTIKWAFTTEDQPFFNFVATEDADSTSAISSLTSGTTGGHVQVDINGTKRWLRYYDSIS
jgi:hypothetical protein